MTRSDRRREEQEDDDGNEEEVEPFLGPQVDPFGAERLVDCRY